MRRIIATLCCCSTLALVASACTPLPEDPNSRSNVARRTETPPMPAPSTTTLIAVPPPSAAEAMYVPGTPVIVAAPAATAAVPLTASEVVASITNNTVSGAAPNGVPYYAYYLPNGQERYRFGNAVNGGVWHVMPDGRLCSQVVNLNGNAEQCYLLYRMGSQVGIWHPGGSFEGVTVLAGNPMRL